MSTPRPTSAPGQPGPSDRPDRDPDDLTVAPDGRPAREQPAWRREFPIDWSADEYVSRRAMMRFMTLTSAAFVAGQAWLAVSTAVKGAEPAVARRAIARVDELAIGDRSYSSWSLRGWLMFARFSITVTPVQAAMYTPEFRAMLAGFGAARLVHRRAVR